MDWLDPFQTRVRPGLPVPKKSASLVAVGEKFWSLETMTSQLMEGLEGEKLMKAWPERDPLPRASRSRPSLGSRYPRTRR